MKRFKLYAGILCFIIIVFCLVLYVPLKAAQIPTGQDVGAVQRGEEEIKEKKAVTKKLIKGKEPPALKEEGEITPPAPEEKIKVPEAKVLIEKINVTGVTVFSKKYIDSLIAEFEGKELTLTDFRDAADLITNEYRKKGYLTSMAYLPPQKIEKNTLAIAVIEGRVGNINLTGNKYFRTNLLLRYLDLKKDELFNYDVLRKNINRLNQHPDRKAKVVLARGSEFGQTDVNIQVEDRAPMHLTLGYSNYNSRYLDRNIFTVEYRASSLFGLDDVISIEMQSGEDIDTYKLLAAKYFLEIFPGHKIGCNYNYVEQELQREVKRLRIEGKGHVISPYYTSNIVNTDNFIANVNVGFDYKEIENKVLGLVLSEDDTRVAKLGFDLDISDRFNGRTIIMQEFDYGIPDFLGGLKKDDPMASRAKADGKFFRTITNVARIQTLPASMALMLKGSMQLTPDDLVAAEQFQIGGATTVRGYPRSEHVGDYGYNASAELYIPPFLIPKAIKVPFTKTTFFDSLRFLGFFDWGLVNLKTPAVGETDDEEIYSAGGGVRFNIPELLSVSFDLGVALGQDASDGSDTRGYVEVKLFF